jgi:arginase
MNLEQVAGILHAVAAEAGVVGMAITEFMPWNMIRLSRSLRSLPLLKDG